jgi:hypothetical protein
MAAEIIRLYRERSRRGCEDRDYGSPVARFIFRDGELSESAMKGLRESLPDADIVVARIKGGTLEIDFRGTMGPEIRADVKIGDQE